MNYFDEAYMNAKADFKQFRKDIINNEIINDLSLMY